MVNGTNPPVNREGFDPLPVNGEYPQVNGGFSLPEFPAEETGGALRTVSEVS